MGISVHIFQQYDVPNMHVILQEKQVTCTAEDQMAQL